MKLTRSTLHPNVRLLQGHTLCVNAIFMMPVFVPYYRTVIGIGFQEFLISEAVFAATMLLMEVPTGWLSDVWTRKKTLSLSTIVGLIAWAVLWQANSFAMAVLAHALLGVSVSLLSGTVSALLYDSLLEDGMEHYYQRLEGFRHGVSLYTVGGSALLGGILYSWQAEFPILMTMAFYVLALVITLCTIEPSRHQERPQHHPLVDMAQTVRYALHGHSEIAGIILLSAISFAGTKVLLWAQQPYYTLLEIPLEWYGILMSLGFLVGGLAGHYGHLLKWLYSDRVLFLTLLLFLVLASFLSGLGPGWYGIPLILSGSLIWGFGLPRMSDAINKRVTSERRATVLSTAGLMRHVMAIPLFLLIGEVEDQAGITVGLLMLAGGLFIGGSAALWLLKAQGKNNTA